MLLTGDEECTSFHCSNKENCSAVWAAETTWQVTDSRIMGEGSGCFWMVVNSRAWFLSWWNF